MITMRPHNADWDAIADAFGDESWRATNMRKYWERLEHCDYAPDSPRSGHGHHGWLHTDVAHTALAFGDERLRAIVEAAVGEAAVLNPDLYLDAARQVLRSGAALWDPNDARLVDAAAEGMVFVPLHMNGGTRESTRDYIRATVAACRGNLSVELHALATRVIFDGTRAVGVEYLSGENIYRASPEPRDTAGVRREVRVRREVILCGGVFNTPQLLMLSGVGAAAELHEHDIATRVDLPGVGKNLQDRYEMSVVYELDDDLDVLHDMNISAPDPSSPDPALVRWWFDRNGPYATNGVVGALVQKSKDLSACPIFSCSASSVTSTDIFRATRARSLPTSVTSRGACSRRTPRTAGAPCVFARAIRAIRRS